MDDRLAKDTSRLNVGQEMFSDKYPIESDVAANIQNSVTFFWKEFRQHHGVNGSSRGMSTRVTKTGFRVSQSKLVVQFIRAPSLKMILWGIDDPTYLRFNLLQQGLSFGEFSGLEEGANGRFEQGKGKSGVFHSPGFFGWGASLESGADGFKIGGLFG